MDDTYALGLLAIVLVGASIATIRCLTCVEKEFLIIGFSSFCIFALGVGLLVALALVIVDFQISFARGIGTAAVVRAILL